MRLNSTTPQHEKAEAMITPEIKRLLDKQNVSVLIEDLERKVLLVNQAFCDLFELDVLPEDMLYRNCSNELQRACLLFERPEAFVAFVEASIACRERNTSEALNTVRGFAMEVTYGPLYTGGLLSGHLWFHQKLEQQ